MDCKLTHAQHDPAHCLAHGLFRSLRPGERRAAKLDVTYQHRGTTLRWLGPEPLGAEDMRLLQVLVALAAISRVALSPAPQTDLGRQLQHGLASSLEGEALLIESSISQVLREAGLSDGGRNVARLKESLVRISAVTVIATRDAIQASAHLLSHVIDSECGRLHVALNQRITGAALGIAQYARVELAEVRMLHSDPARLIHQRLSAWIDPGSSGRASTDTLAGYAWPTDAPSPAATRKRRKLVRRAMSEIARAGWSVARDARGQYQIGRPARCDLPTSVLSVTQARTIGSLSRTIGSPP